MTEVLEEKKVKIIKKDVIRIMPYINPESENMGLTGYGMALHDGANQKEHLTYLEVNKGVRRYLTGLNEFAPEIVSMTDKDAQKARIKEIRNKVIFLEKCFGANELKIDDEKFWENVKTVHPKNYDFWNNIFIVCGNEPVFLNPELPDDLIILCGIEAGGFGLVAKSYEDAKSAATPPKFYLDRAADVSINKNELKRLKNKAGALLNTLYEKDPTKLLYIVKNIDPKSNQYKKSTSVEILYNYLDEHIEGKGFQRIAKRAAIEFIEIAEMKAEDLRIKAVIADATIYKIVQSKPDGLIYHNATGSMLGRNAEELLAYFKSELNAKIWEHVRKDVEKYWND